MIKVYKDILTVCFIARSFFTEISYIWTYISENNFDYITVGKNMYTNRKMKELLDEMGIFFTWREIVCFFRGREQVEIQLWIVRMERIFVLKIACAPFDSQADRYVCISSDCVSSDALTVLQNEHDCILCEKLCARRRLSVCILRVCQHVSERDIRRDATRRSCMFYVHDITVILRYFFDERIRNKY